MLRLWRWVTLALLLTATLAQGQVTRTMLAREDLATVTPIIATSTGCTTAALQAAITAQGSAERVMLLPPRDGAGVACTWDITSNTTVPATMILQIPMGTHLTIANGVTLTLARRPILEHDDWYTVTGTGTVTITEKAPDDAMAPYITSGCEPPVPSSAASFDAFACALYTRNSGGLNEHINQVAAAVGPLNSGDGTYWLAACRTTTETVTGWTRQSGTIYVWQKATSQPSTPTGCLIFNRTTVAAGVIATSVAIGQRVPVMQETLTRTVYNVLDHGLKGDCSTNDAIAFQLLADTMQNGGTIYFPQTSGGCYLFGTSRVNIKKDVTVACEGWQTYLSWDTENASDPGCPDGMECEYGGLNIHHDDMVDGTYLTHAVVRGCHMKFGGARGNTYQLWKRGLNIYQANNVLVEGNLFQNVTGEVIGIGNWGSATKGSRSWVVNNLLINFAQVGINPNNSENTVAGNRLRTGALAVEMGGSGTIASHNEAFDLTAQMFAVQTTNGQIVHNVCRTCYTSNPATTDGVISIQDRGNCSGTTDLLIANNVLVNSSSPANGGGIVVYNSGVACSPNRNSRINVQNNMVAASFPTGIYIDQCDDCTITGNDVKGATVALAITTGSGKVVRSYFADNRLGGTTPIQDQSVYADNNIVGWNAWYNGTTGALRSRWGSNLVAFTSGDTTPSVRGNFFWSVNNSGATSITALDDIEPGNPPVCLRMTNGNTTFVDSASLQMAGGANFTPDANDVVCFANDGSVTYEVSRSAN